jgi:multidrug efflux system outer membrane protein
MSKKLILMLLAGVSLSACGWMAPRFNLPEVAPKETLLQSKDVDATFVSPTVVGSWVVVDHDTLKVEHGTPWYKGLNIPGLDEMMAEALKGNPDLKAMAGRVKQARGEAAAARAALLPQVNANADITRGRSSPAQLGLPQGSVSKEGTLYDAGLSASFELDLFGRISGEAKASRLAALSQKELYESTKLVLEADVARSVVLVLTSQDEMQAWKTLLANAEQSYKIIDLRYKAGEVAVNDWQASFSQLQVLRAQALDAAGANAHARNALAILVGQVPQGFTLPSSMLTTRLAEAPAVPQGISSTVLLQRPDVRAAAYQLEAANTRIGVARAAFFPSLSLTGNGGFASDDLSNLFNWNNRTWAAGPVLSLPIFQGGALFANLKRSWGIYEQNVEAYRGQVLGAFRDVADATTDARNSRLQADSFAQAMAASQKTEAAMATRYKMGDVGRYELLNADITSQEAVVNHARAQYANYAAVIRFIQAIGGNYQ